MQRPELRQKDLDEVDRLVNLANACDNTDPIMIPNRTATIRMSALVRAAEIMGIDSGEKEKTDELEKDN